MVAITVKQTAGGEPLLSTWSYAPPASGISNTTTAVTIRAAQPGLRNYLVELSLAATALTTATEVAIRDGAGGTVLWRGWVGTAGLPVTNVDFSVPLVGSVNTLMEVVTLTASGTGSVYVNATGYSA